MGISKKAKIMQSRLEEIIVLKKQIDIQHGLLLELRNDAERFKSEQINLFATDSGEKKALVEGFFERAVKYEEMLYRVLIEKYKKYIILQKKIEEIGDPKIKLILYYRYVLCRGWKDIPELTNYTLGHCMRLHRLGLKELSDKYEN